MAVSNELKPAEEAAPEAGPVETPGLSLDQIPDDDQPASWADEPEAPAAEQPAEEAPAAEAPQPDAPKEQPPAQQKKEEPPAEAPPPAEAAPDFLSANPWDVASQEAELLGEAPEWTQRRAYEILQEQQEVRSFVSLRPQHTAEIEQGLTTLGLPAAQARQVAEWSADVLTGAAKVQGARVVRDAGSRQIAVLTALGQLKLSELEAARAQPAVTPAPEDKDPGTARPAVTNAGGTQFGSKAKFSPDDQKYLAAREKQIGRRLTNHELRQMAEAGEIG